MKIKPNHLLIVAMVGASFFMGWFLSGRSSSAQDQLRRPEGQLQRPGDSIEQQVLLPHPKSNLGVVGNMAFVVHKVEPGSPAEQIGLRRGDLITEWNGKQIISIRDFLMMEQLEPGQPVEVQFFRADFAKGKYEILKGGAPLAVFPSDTEPKR